MRQRRVLAMLVLALLLAAVPTAAQAKGASAATISGGGPGGLPGSPIDIAGDGEPGAGFDLANLAEAAGVFALLFEDGPGGELAAAPTGERGPRYTITWTFPNGAGGEDKVRQSVWPYAAGGPVSYMRPGQPVLDGATKGGWYRSADNLRQTLTHLGLPDRPPLAAQPSPPRPPARRPPRPRPPTRPRRCGRGSPLGVGLLLAVAAGALLLRRRYTPAPPRPADRGLSDQVLDQGVLVAVGVAELGPAAPGLVGGGSVNSTPRPRSSSKVAWRSSQANTSPGVERHQRRLGPGRATSTQRPSAPIGSSRRFSKPSAPT